MPVLVMVTPDGLLLYAKVLSGANDRSAMITSKQKFRHFLPVWMVRAAAWSPVTVDGSKFCLFSFMA